MGALDFELILLRETQLSFQKPDQASWIIQKKHAAGFNQLHWHCHWVIEQNPAANPALRLSEMTLVEETPQIRKYKGDLTQQQKWSSYISL